MCDLAEDKREVVIDTDFFIKFTEKDSTGKLFIKIMNEMNVTPVMHHYVYTEELMGNSTAKQLVESGSIKVYNHSDFLNQSNEERYKENFKKAYKAFNYQDFAGDVFTYRHDKESLGEIRSSLMAFHMGIGIFMSDDGGAKKYVVNQLSSRKHKISVYNVYDTLKNIGEKQVKYLSWSEIKATAKFAFEKIPEKLEEINNIWHNTDKQS
ncbi:hypothetical protein Ccar_24315 [Clostridium carboxidivorans P7]|nr:hypothetical protein Ccar_24315 [Clostridium carboxidivorans P7]EFG86612.1 hypothetical protein CLCAR_3559 [Clostridium carboxidivorans P7]